MARGFNTTYGTNGSDKITTALTTHASARTYHIREFFHGAGGSSLGRVFDKRVSSGQVEIFYHGSSAAYERQWSGGNAVWSWSAAPTTDTWVDVVLAYDSSSTANDPDLYYDGVAQTRVLNPTPSGSTTDTTDAYVLGNRGNDNARGYDGMLAEWAVWDRILTAGEIAALAAGYSPLLFPNSLVDYIPMLRDNVDRMRAAPTVSGAAVQPHPRVIYPGRSPGRRFTTATGGGGSPTVKTLAALGVG